MLKKILIVAVIAYLAFYFTNNQKADFLNKMNLDDVKSTLVSNNSEDTLKLKNYYPCDIGGGTKAICGSVKNISGQNLRYAQVEINFFDAKGNLINSASDNIFSLKKDATWNFKVAIQNEKVKSYKIKKIAGIKDFETVKVSDKPLKKW